MAKKAHCGFILDKSGSMQAHRATVIEGYNNYLDTLQRTPANIEVSRTVFADAVTIEPPGPLSQASRLGTESYNPDGNTALLDGIGLTIRSIEARMAESDTAIVVVLTDGEENASEEFEEEELRRLVEAKRATGRWTFIFLGMGNSFRQASRYGFDPKQIKGVGDSRAGLIDAFSEAEKRTRALLTDGSRGPIAL
jgi:uncharacterized protein YegL